MTQFVHGLSSPEWHPVENIGDEEIPPHGVMILENDQAGHNNYTNWLRDSANGEPSPTLFLVNKPTTPYLHTGVYMVNSARPIPASIGRVPYSGYPVGAAVDGRNGRGMGSFAVNPTIVKVDVDFDNVTTPSPTYTTALLPGYSAGVVGGGFGLTPGQPGFRWVGTGKRQTGATTTEPALYFIQNFTGRNSFWGTADANAHAAGTSITVSITHGPGGGDTGVNITTVKNPFGFRVDSGMVVFVERYDSNAYDGLVITNADTSQLIEASGAPGTGVDEVDHLARKGIIYRDTSTGGLYVCKDASEGAATWERLARYSELHDESHSH